MRGRRLLPLLLAAVLLLAVPGRSLCTEASASESEEQRIIRLASNGVVRIIAIKNYGDGGMMVGSGTAFAVGTAGQATDTFVTNWHVVTNEGEGADEVYILLDSGAFAYEVTYDRWGNSSLEFIYGDNFDEQAMLCEVVDTTTGYPDVAVVRTEKPIEGIQALPLLSAENVKVLDTVYALGYPAVMDSDTAVQNGQSTFVPYTAGTADLTITPGSVSRINPLGWAEDTKALTHNAHINHGNSGGPLLNRKGAVVGINTYGNTEDTVFCYSIFIDYAMEMLDKHNIHYDVYTEPEPVPEPEPEPEPEPDPEPEPEPEPAPEPDPKDGEELLFGLPRNLVLILGALFGTLILIVVILIIVLAKKRRVQTVYVMPPATEPDVPTGLTLYALDGELRGRSWSVGQRPMTMGREPGATVQFSPEAQGVSRRHCTLGYANGELYLTDTSSCGTFVGGRRLPQNTAERLAPGESFCLANSRNTFVVRKAMPDHWSGMA